MENNKQIQTSANLTSYPVLLNDLVNEIEAITDKDYNNVIMSGETPAPVAKVILSMATDTYKGCVARCYDGTPSIKQMASDNPIAYTRIVKMLLTQMCFTMNVKETMKPEQRNVIPTLLLTEFAHLRINDIGLICRLISTGKYKVFERVDVEFFFSCVREYEASDERISAREQHHKQGHVNKLEACETLLKLPKETRDLLTKRQEPKIIMKPSEVPMFKATDKQAMKKLKGDGRNE